MRLILKLASALVIVTALLLGGLFLLPADRLGKIVSDQLSTQLGRAVSLGEARVTLWPVAGISAKGLRIANAPWAGSDPMLEARSASFGLDAKSALSGKFAFDSIVIDGPTLRLTSDAQGRANYDFGTSGGSGSGSSAAPDVTLDLLTISNATIILASPGSTTRLDDTDLTLTWPDANGPVQADARLAFNGQPLRIAARMDTPRRLLEGTAVPAVVDLTTSGGTINFNGLLGSKPEAAGTLRLNLTDTARAAAAFGIPGLDLPHGLGRAVSGQIGVTYTGDNRLSLRDGTLKLDHHDLALAADITLAAKPRVNAHVSAGALDFSSLTKASGSSAPSGPGWDTTAIDASALGLIDGEIALTAPSIDLGDLQFGRIDTVLTIDDRRAVVDLRELQGYDGRLSGQVIANNRSGFSTRADLAFDGVALRPLLTAAMDIDNFSGIASGRFNLLGWGDNLAQIMGNLKGDGSLRAGPGRIEGIDLEAALGGNASGGTTIFDTGTATFTVDAGRLSNSDLALQLPRLQASGEGWVDLGGQSLDYLVTVRDPQARGGRGLAFPVRIKGPWASASIRVDGGELIDQNFADERDALKEKARAKVEEAIQRELGVTVEQGQSVEKALEQAARNEVNQAIGKELGLSVDQGETVEDALRGELEKRARDGLLNLFNR